MSYRNTSGISRGLVLLSLLVFTGGAFAQGSIINTDLMAGATTNYTYQFTLTGTDTLFPNEVFTITYPSGQGFVLTNVVIAGSSNIGGGFSASGAGNVVTITRDGTGDTLTVADGSTFQITFGVVTNTTTTDGGPHTISLSTSPGNVTDNTSVTITPGSLDHFAFDAISTQTAGSSFDIDMTAEDEFDNTVTSFTGTVILSDNTGTISPTTSNSFSSGTRTENVSITKAQADVQITARESGGSALGQSNSFTVNAGSLDHFTVSDPSPATPNADDTFSYTVSAFDANNNAVSFNGTVTLSDNTGTLTPTSQAMNGTTMNVSGAAITTAQGGVRITATEGGGATGVSNAFTVDPGTLASFSIDPISDQATNTAFPITVTAQDANSNTVTAFTGTVDINDLTGTISPTTSGSFVAGRLTENVTITQARTNDVITVTNSSGTENETSNQFDVTATTVDHFTISSISDQTAGSSFNITITAEDVSNNPVTGFTGTVNLSDLTGSISPTLTTNFVSGVLSNFSVTITQSQTSDTITATGVGKAGISNTFDVNSAALDHFTFDQISSPQTAGTQFNITLTAKDQFENTVTSFTGPATLSDNTGTISPTSTGTFTAGVRTGLGVTITQSASNVRITATNGISSQSNAFNVDPGPVASFVLEPISDQATNTPFSITVTGQDANSNTATGFTGTVAISDLTGTISPTTSGNFVSGRWTGNVTITQARIDDEITVTNSSGSETGTSNQFDVSSTSIDHFRISTILDQTAGSPFSITVTAEDASNNPVSSFTGTVNLSDLTGTISPTISDNFTSGSWTGNVSITESRIANTITATGLGKSGTSNTFNLDPDVLDHFTFDTISSPQIAGTQFNITLTAKDQFENTITSFTGPATLSDDTGTISPTSTGTFTSGVRTALGVTITQSASNVRITATSGTVSSQSNFFNVTSQSVQSFMISTISSPQEAGVPFLVTITAKDGLNGTGNVATDFNGTVNLSLNLGTLTPTVSGNFSSGTWTGNITVQSLGGSSTDKILTADDGASHTGSSNSFDVNPGAPTGSVTLTATPNTLPADGASTSQITSGTIFDSFSNSVGAGKLFTVTLSDQGLGTITTPDADGAPGHQVATNSSSELDFTFQAGTTGGTVTINVSSVGGSATGNVNISIGSMAISSVGTAASFVSQGQNGVNVQMVVQNLSTSLITNLSPSLTFTGPGGNRTGQYTTTRTDGVVSIPASGQATFIWDVDVSPSAALELITIDGSISGEINSVPVSAQGAATTAGWTVQMPAQISAVNVTSLLDTVVLGQQGNTVTIQISNPAATGAASAVIDAIRLKFLKNGVEDKTSDFPFTPLGGNPTSVPAGGVPLNFDFTVNVGASADTGNYVVDFEVDAHDTNSVGLTLQDLNATTTHAWTVKGAPTLQILSLTPQPVSTFRAGQTDDWTVRMAVRNNGPDAIDLNFSIVNSFIRFIIGVDVTNQYAIIQPTQLVVAGTNRLNSGATDTLDFVVDATGTTTGTATITGRVQGTDVSTSNTIFDDTQDGGTGVVIITSQSETVSIANTTANTPNVLQNIGIVNTGQPFQVQVDIDNDLDEPVENVLVRLTTNGPSQIAQNQLTIPLIAANNSEIINFSVTANGTPNSIGETFTAQILSATGQQTQQPAPIGPSANNTAIFQIQTAADLQLHFTKLDTFPSTDEVFIVEATVSNLGESLVDNSGTVDLTIPAGYTLVSGTLTNAPFTVNLPVQWQVRAPATATSPQTFTAAINQRPLEFNTDTFAGVSVPSDAQDVQTRETDLAILSFSVISPLGATDNTLSTDQRFTLRATISATQNIESVQADLTLPQDYDLAVGLLSQTLSPGQTQVDWQIDAPSQPHNPRAIQVQMQGFDGGTVIADTTAQFNLSAVLKATMDFDHFENNTIQTVRLSVGQASTLTALVKNVGQAGVIGTGTLVLDLAGSGITALSPLTQTFNPDVPVVWNIQAPSVPTQPQSISVTMVSVPQDQNTNDLTAFNQPTVRTIQIVTGDAGGLSIDKVSVSAPQGAADGVISTEQQFTITADYSWQNTENLSASIVLPTGYSASSLSQNITSQSGTESLQWQITAPVNATSQGFIRFEATGTDVSSAQQVNAQPDSLPFTVVGKAQLNLNAAITAPPSATDRIVTIGQTFMVTANLPNSGQAALAGEDSVQISLPVGYTTASQLIQALLPGGQAIWTVLAPPNPTSILDMQVEIITRGATDENTNQLPPLTPVPPRITIPVQTQAIGLNLTLLDQRKPTTIVRGGTNSIFGLRFENNSDTDIDIESIDLRVKDNQNNDIAPNSVFTNLSVVDYDNNSISFESVSPPGANPIAVNFSPALRIAPSQVQSIEFFVTIDAQTEANHFLLSIDSPQDNIRAIDSDLNRIDVRDDSSGIIITTPLAAGVVGLTDPELEASFFNYPNPFGRTGRAATSFNYNLTQASNVTIRIYTLLGELVKTYQFQATDQQGLAGNHFDQVFWDGTNEKGQKVLNGVYVAVLITDTNKATTKIAIAR